MSDQPCDCRRHTLAALPQVGDAPVRWARCPSCQALSRWEQTPPPTWLQRHAALVLLVGIAITVITALREEILP